MRLPGLVPLLAVVVPAALMTTGCGGDSPTSATPPEPSPDFQVSCQGPRRPINQGCGLFTCSVSSLNGFSGEVALSISNPPEGLDWSFGPNPLSVSGTSGPAESGLAVSAPGSVEAGTHVMQVVGASGAVSRSFRLELEINATIPEMSGLHRNDMAVAGCAGYVDGVLGPTWPQSLHSVFVGAWRGTWRDRFCTQTLGDSDGFFSLVIPHRCGIRFDEPVYLTAGGLDTCVTVGFRPGVQVVVTQLLGRHEGTCP